MLENNSELKGVVGAEKGSALLLEAGSSVEMERLVSQLVTIMYTGPSIDLGVNFRRDSNITGITSELGQPLIEIIHEQVFNTSIVNKIINSKSVTSYARVEIQELGKILSIDEIPANEREKLIGCVLPSESRPDGWGKDIRRVATYCLLLTVAKNNHRTPRASDVLEMAMLDISDVPSFYTEVLNGWLIYLIRDLLAVVHEIALERVVVELSSNKQKQFKTSDIVREILSNEGEINKSLRNMNLLKPDESYTNLTYSSLLERVIPNSGPTNTNGLVRWSEMMINEEQLISELLTHGIGVVGLLPIVWILISHRLDDENISSPMADYLSHNGWSRIGLKQVVRPILEEWEKDDTNFSHMVSDLILRTIDQHIRITWSRMSRDMLKDVSVLSVDGENLKFKKDFEGGRTDSRLSFATGWLRQLQLIDDEGITTDGKNILTRSEQILGEYYSKENS
jgi:hypothetical protein